MPHVGFVCSKKYEEGLVLLGGFFLVRYSFSYSLLSSVVRKRGGFFLLAEEGLGEAGEDEEEEDLIIVLILDFSETSQQLKNCNVNSK